MVALVMFLLVLLFCFGVGVEVDAGFSVFDGGGGGGVSDGVSDGVGWVRSVDSCVCTCGSSAIGDIDVGRFGIS